MISLVIAHFSYPAPHYRFTSAHYYIYMCWTARPYVLAYATICVGLRDHMCKPARPYVLACTTICVGMRDRMC